MLKAFLAAVIAVAMSVPASAGIVEDLGGCESCDVSKEAGLKPQAEFCAKGETPEKCADRYEDEFHAILQKHQKLLTECVSRAGRKMPKEVSDKLAKGPVKLPNGQEVTLDQANVIFASENASRTASCILALTHKLNEEMGVLVGVKPSGKDYLKEFDEKEKEARGE